MGANDRQVGGTHYRNAGVQPWDVIDTWPLDQQIGAYRAGALKYTMRMGTKDESIQEIQKGIHYLEKLVECLTKQAKTAVMPRLSDTVDAYDEQHRLDQMVRGLI